MGTASDTHHVIIHAATANTLLAPGEINVSGRSVKATTNNNGPKKNPNWRADGNEFTNTFEFVQNYFFWFPVQNLKAISRTVAELGVKTTLLIENTVKILVGI